MTVEGWSHGYKGSDNVTQSFIKYVSHSPSRVYGISKSSQNGHHSSIYVLPLEQLQCFNNAYQTIPGGRICKAQQFQLDMDNKAAIMANPYGIQ